MPRRGTLPFQLLRPAGAPAQGWLAVILILGIASPELPGWGWAAVTPIALDRHPKAEGEVEASIADACERIGLPRPERIVAGKHAAVSGAVSARRSARAPAWTEWPLPGSLAAGR